MSLLLLIIFWRFFLFLIAYISQELYKFTPMFPYSDIYFTPSGLPQWIWSFANFDGVHYLTIANRGYFAQFTQAFFPLYPLSLRFIGMLLKDKNLILSGLLFSFTSFIVAVFFLKKMLKLDYSQKVVQKSIVVLLLFPTSFFFASLYSESFFFLLVVMTFYLSRKKQWWLSCIFAMVASATRISGAFLLPCLILEYIYQNNNIQSISYIKNNLLKISISVIKSKFFYIVPLGLIAYMYYLKVTYNDALYFWHAQPAFGAERSIGLILPPQVIWRYIKIVTTIEPYSYSFWYALWEGVAYLFGAVALFMGHRMRIRLSYLVFGWFILLVPGLTGTFSSMPRYLLLAFPIYIVIGSIRNKYIYGIYLVISTLLLVIFTLNFSRGLWVA